MEPITKIKPKKINATNA